MYRTLHNLRFIEQNKRHTGPFEVTQLINSFLAVLAHPWDQLLDKKKLAALKLKDPAFVTYGFPTLPLLPFEGTPKSIATAEDLLGTVRNGMAHGNIELLNRSEFQGLRPHDPLPKVKEKEIAGLKLWNYKYKTTTMNWCTVISIFEMKQMLQAMRNLCEDRELWRPEHAHLDINGVADIPA